MLVSASKLLIVSNSPTPVSVKEFEKASTITFLMEHLNSSGFCDVVCRYISKQKNIKLTDVYYSLYEYFVGNPSTVLYSHFQILVDHVEQRNTEKLLEGIQFIGMFNDIGDYQRSKFLQELDTFMKTYDVFQTEDVIKLQNHKQKHFGQELEYEILMDTNVFEYLYADENLKEQQNVYVVKNSGIEKKFKPYGNFIVSSRLNQNWKTKVVKK